MKYPCVLTQRDVLTILKVGLYRVCPLTGAVTNQRGLVISPFYDDQGRAFVRLYGRGTARRSPSPVWSGCP